MPYQTLKLKPGVDVEQSPILNAAGFNTSNLIRFFAGLPQKLGGWTHLNQTQLTGSGRGMHAWDDLSGVSYLAVGTEQFLEIFTGGLLYNMTPLRKTDDLTPDFSTVINTPTVTIGDPANGATIGDWVNVRVQVSVGGLIIQGFYQIQSIVDANSYTITAASNATATVSNTGAVPVFHSTMSSPDVDVALPNHGLAISDPFYVHIATTVGGIVMAADSVFFVTSVTNANVFVIAPGPSASSTQTVAENGGDAHIEYLIPTGLPSATPLSGYGIGDYGAGDYGLSGDANVIAPLRQWAMDNWGEDLIANYGGSPIFIWFPPAGLSNVALAIDTTNFPSATNPPTQVNWSFISSGARQIIALGCDPDGGGAQDALLLRYCNVDDYTDWHPTAVNQAGSKRFPTGSRLVGGLQMPLFAVIWTDIDLWVMSYLGPPLIYGYNQVASGCGLIAPRACGVYKNFVYWAANNGFFTFDGNGVQPIECPVWDAFWFNLNRQQIDKVTCGVNSWFGEITWYYPSASGSGENDSYIKYNAMENTWDYGSLARLSWIDNSVLGAPIGVDDMGYLQQHEVSNDADGQPMVCFVRTGWFAALEGTLFSFMERMLADLIVTGSETNITIAVYAQDYPIGPVRTYGPFTWNPNSGPPLFITRARGRFYSIQIGSSTLGNFWRLGGIHYMLSTAGRR